MKTIIITCALALYVSALNAQTSEKTRTVRIKKIENINGVEKVTDTTFTSTGPAEINGEGSVSVREIKDKDGKMKQIVLLQEKGSPQIIMDGGGGQDETLTLSSGKDGEKKVFRQIIIHDSVNVSKEISSIPDFEIKGNDGNDDDPMIGKTVIIKRPASGCGASKEETDAAPVLYQVTILRKIKLTEPSENDKNLLGKPANKLGVNEINFYPNPGNGKFNLSFKAQGAGETEVSVMDVQGKTIYSEKVQENSGVYSKQIDLSQNRPGIYFLKIRQGNSEALKKLVLE
jgi:hypothetical protein